jgi:hypothetical protein
MEGQPEREGKRSCSGQVGRGALQLDLTEQPALPCPSLALPALTHCSLTELDPKLFAPGTSVAAKSEKDAAKQEQV